MKSLSRIALVPALFGALAFVPVALADDAESPTYSRQIAKIFNEHCVSCHRPGEVAPMSLKNYEEVRPWVKAIRKAVLGKTMPPWHADSAYGKFSNDRRLSEDEVALIGKWIDGGAAEGDRAELPPEPKFVEGWRLGEPDYVITFPEIKLPAGGPDIFQDIAASVDLPEDKWITAIEIQPGNRRVTHHVIAFAIDPGSSGPNGWLGGWAAGLEPMVFPEGTGRVIKKGATVIGDMHYHPADTAMTDQTKIGLHFAKVEPKKEVVNLWIQNAGFKIPAGAENHKVQSSFTFDQDSHVLSFLPHMHYRGKDFTYTAKFPDGREEVLLRVGKYDFNWQTMYTLEKPLAAPKGTRINCVAHYNNSTNNPANPDPTRDVTFGNQSFDEMMIGFVDFVTDEGVRPESAEIKLAAMLRQMISEHPGDVFEVRIQDEEDTVNTALYFPQSGEATWMVAMDGRVYEGKLRDIKWFGPIFSAKLNVAGLGTFPLKGGIDRKAGKLAGEISIINQKLTFEGTRAKQSRGL